MEKIDRLLKRAGLLGTMNDFYPAVSFILFDGDRCFLRFSLWNGLSYKDAGKVKYIDSEYKSIADAKAAYYDLLKKYLVSKTLEPILIDLTMPIESG